LNPAAPSSAALAVSRVCFVPNPDPAPDPAVYFTDCHPSASSALGTTGIRTAVVFAIGHGVVKCVAPGRIIGIVYAVRLFGLSGELVDFGATGPRVSGIGG